MRKPKRGRGRPKHPERDVRVNRCIRFSDVEWRWLHARAEDAGRVLSEDIRRRLLRGMPKPAE